MNIITKLTSSGEKNSLQEILESLPSLQNSKLSNHQELVKFNFFSEQRKHENVSINYLKIFDKSYYKPFLRLEKDCFIRTAKPDLNFGYIFEYKKDLELFLKEFIESKGGIYSKRNTNNISTKNSIETLKKQNLEKAYKNLENLLLKNQDSNKEKQVFFINGENDLFNLINKIFDNYEYNPSIGKYLPILKFQEILKKKIKYGDKELIGSSLEKVFTTKDFKLKFVFKIFYKNFIKINNKVLEFEINNKNLKYEFNYYNKNDKSNYIKLLNKTDFKLSNSKDLVTNVYIFELGEPSIEKIKLELSKLGIYKAKNPFFSYKYQLTNKTPEGKYIYKVEIEEKGTD